VGWTSPAIVGLFVTFVVLGGAFLLTERSSIQPMVDLASFESGRSPPAWPVRWWHLPGCHCDLLAAVPAGAGRGFSPIEAGLLLTPVPITMALVAPSAVLPRTDLARAFWPARGWRSWSWAS